MSELEGPFRLMVENSHDILTIREADGRLRYANSSYLRLLGYKPEEVVGTTCFDLLHPEDRVRVLTALDGFAKTPGAHGSIQCRALHADGSWRSFELGAFNMLDHPVIRGLVINAREITEREHQEAEKAQVVAELKQTLNGLKTLTSILTICASCKKIHDEGGRWRPIEVYFRDHMQVEFSHAMCPECIQFWYPDNETNEGE